MGDTGHLVEVVSETSAGSRVLGSGYHLGRGLVLTAAHVATGSDVRRKGLWLRPAGAQTWFRAHLAWQPADRSVDVALVEGADPGWPQPPRPPRWGQLAGDSPGVECQVLTFPGPRTTPHDGADGQVVLGTINPLPNARSGLHAVSIVEPPAPLRAGDPPWAGMSGAPVFCGDLLTGVVVQAETSGVRRLAAAPVAGFAGDARFAALVSAATGRLPVVEPVELLGLFTRPAWPAGVASPGGLLRAAAATVRFRGREQTLDELVDWCQESRPFAARVLTGPAGQGKTRLADELARIMAANGWVAGQVRESLADEAVRALATVTHPILLVIDYAEARGEQVLALTDRLAATGVPVRLLLLARSAGEWWTDLAQRLEMPAAPVDELEPAYLDVDERVEAWREAVTDLAAGLAGLPGYGGTAWPEVARRLARAVPADLLSQAYDAVLALHMRALTALLRGSRDEDATDADAEGVLLRHEERYWATAAQAARLERRPEDLRRLVVAATVWPAADPAQALAVLAHLRDTAGLDERERLAVVRWLAGLYPAPGRYWAGPQPDRLGERLVAEVLADPGNRDLLTAPVPDAAPDQLHHALALLARAAIHHPHLEAAIADLVAGNPDTTGPVAIAVATESENPTPVVAALAAMLDRDVPDRIHFLTALANSLPKHSLVLHDVSGRIWAAFVAGFRDLAAANPRTVLPGLAAALHNLSSNLGEAGRSEDGLAAAQEAVEVYRRLAQADGDAFRPSLATALISLSTHLAGVGRAEDGLAAAQEAVEVYRGLAQTRPETFLANLAAALTSLATHLEKLGRPEEALTATEESVSAYRRLAQTRPETFLADLAAALTSLATHLGKLGRPEEALTAAEESVELYYQLAEVDPDAFGLHIAGALNNLSVQLRTLSRREEALAAAAEVVYRYRRIAERNPDAFTVHLAEALTTLSVGLIEVDRYEEAIATAEEAAGIYRELAAARPDAFRPDLARTLRTLSISQGELERHDQAAATAEEAAGIYRDLAAMNPEAFRPDLVTALYTLSLWHSALARYGEAVATAEEIVSLCRHLVLTHQDMFLPWLAIALTNLSLRQGELGHRDAAVAAAEEATSRYRQLVQKRFAGFRSDLLASLDYLARLLDEAGETQRAQAVRDESTTLRDGRPRSALTDSGIERSLPEALDLLDVLGIADITPEAITVQWRRSDFPHAVPIGESPAGSFALDLVRDGPHALIVGATGSGKSELLRTLVTALAVTHSPEQVTFLLVEHKGGAGFEDLRHLPHTVGLITRIDPHLAQRALTSLAAEVRGREQLIDRWGAHDLDHYNALQLGDVELSPVPRLLLVVDEFSAIAQAVPNFIPGLLSLAQRGRAVGVHLILATQRLSGPLSQQVRRQIDLRIALRVNDPHDSTEVIDTVDAALIPGIPGRGYARLGPDVLIPFQTGYVGRRLTWIAEEVGEAARRLTLRPPHPPLLPPLPGRLRLADLPAPIAGNDLAPVAYGLEDLPAEQSYRAATFTLTAPTHLLVAGDPGSGRSQFLRTLAGAVARRHSSADVHLYGIDCADGALLALAELPHCGAVVTHGETTRATRLLNRLTAEVRRRQELLAEGGFVSIAEQWRAASDRRRLPYILVLIDGSERFISTLGRLHDGRLSDQLGILLSDGGRVGVHLVLAGDQRLLHESFSLVVSEKLVLPLADRNELALVGIRPSMVPTPWGPGRALRAESGDEVQVALLDGAPNPSGQAAALAVLAATVRERDIAVPLVQRPFQVEEVQLVADRFHVGDAQGRPVGREDVLAWLHDRHATRASAALLGPRRAGKTWVLAELSRRLRGKGATSVHQLVLPTPSTRVETDDLAALLDGSVARSAAPALALQDKAQRQAGTADPLVFLLDEVGRLARYDPAAVSWLRDLGQAGACLVYTGTEKDWHTTVRWALTAPGSSFGNDVNARELGPWEESTALTFISGTAANLGVDLVPDTTGKAIIELVGTWPFYLQVIGDAVVRAAQGGDFGPLSNRDALRRLVERRLIDEWTGHFEGRWAEIGPAGRAALLADPGAPPQSLAPAQRNDLRDVGLLRPGDQWPDDPPFFAWVARNAAALRDRERES